MASTPSSLGRRMSIRHFPLRTVRQYASVAAIAVQSSPQPPISTSFPSTQPPSHRRPDFRKTQVLRQYVSLLRSTEMMVLFQHNAVLAHEYRSIRRALNIALQQVDEAQNTNLADSIKLTVIRTGLLDMALRLVKFWDPIIPRGDESETAFTHALSRAAHGASSDRKKKHGLEKLLTGPVVILTLPSSSPDHLRAALGILSPSPAFPAPRKRVNAAYYDLAVQTGIRKLMLLGARVEAKSFDVAKLTWITTLHGGVQGLHAQLVQMLQSVPAGLTGALESAGRSLYGTLEGRRQALEDEGKDGKTEAEAESKDT